jgi:hypothetical protein
MPASTDPPRSARRLLNVVQLGVGTGLVLTALLVYVFGMLQVNFARAQISAELQAQHQPDMVSVPAVLAKQRVSTYKVLNPDDRRVSSASSASAADLFPRLI